MNVGTEWDLPPQQAQCGEKSESLDPFLRKSETSFESSCVENGWVFESDEPAFSMQSFSNYLTLGVLANLFEAQCVNLWKKVVMKGH